MSDNGRVFERWLARAAAFCLVVLTVGLLMQGIILMREVRDEVVAQAALRVKVEQVFDLLCEANARLRALENGEPVSIEHLPDRCVIERID